MRTFVCGVVVGFGCLAAQGAIAAPVDEPAAQAPAAPSAQASPFTAGWRDGFVLQSDDGEFRLQLGLFAQGDVRLAVGDHEGAVTNTFAIRRLRPTFRVRLHNRFDLVVNPDMAGGNLVVQDAYLETRFSPAFRLRVGKTKAPFGLERLQSAATQLFIERALPTALVPNRDVGVQVLGDLGGVVSYAAALLNGVADGASGDVDTTDSKDVAARVLVRPFARQRDSALAGLSVGLAGTTGRQSGASALPTFRTAIVAQPFFAYAGAVADGRRTRISPQVSFYRRVFGGFGEFVRSRTPVAKGGVRDVITHEAWQVAGSVVLTGENATDAGVRPRQNFDFGNGHLGAFQVAARYHVLQVDRAAVVRGFAAPGASLKASAWTVGLNWYLTPYLKYVVNFERTAFDDRAAGARPVEHAVVFRSQVNF